MTASDEQKGAAAGGAGASKPSTPQSFKQRLIQKSTLALIMLNIVGPFWWWPISAWILIANPLTIGRGFMLAYLVYIFVMDRDAFTKAEGATPIRRLKFWRHLAEYFPANLVKTADIDANHSYIFCGHPHGIACFSFVANFFIEGTGFSSVFPGLSLYPVLLEEHFWAPIHREIALWSGFRGNSRRSITNLLSGPPGSSVFLIPGGAPEALESRPGEYNLVLQKRKGFVRLAMLTGAQLVPVVAFGEPYLFDVTAPTPGGTFHKMQQFILKHTSFGIPVISGAGFWSGGGPLPKSLPLTTVVGKPLSVGKWEGEPTGEEFHKAIADNHARYCTALQQLFDEHKAKYDPGFNGSLTFKE